MSAVTPDRSSAGTTYGSVTGLPPGPRLPFLVQTVLLWTRPKQWLQRCHERYGTTFTVRAAPLGTMVYVADPADIRSVLGGDPSVFHGGEANWLMRGILGDDSVLLVDEDRHREQRKLLMSPFHTGAVRRQAELMAQIAAEQIDRWPVGTEFPVAPRTAAITLEVILRTVIGADDPARLDALRGALSGVVEMNLLDLVSMMWPGLLRYPPWRGVRRRRARADALIHAEIAARRTDPALDQRSDVLSMLIRARDDRGEPMDDGELRDHLVTLLLAGHETTATALAWACERLTRHPEVLSEAVRAADEDDTQYLDALVKETLRNRTVVNEIVRTLTVPTRVGHYLLPTGVNVASALELVHLATGGYPDPERFDPRRMIAAPPSSTIWIPFGAGERRCLGATFAQVEMRVVLREILRRVRLSTTDAPGEGGRVKHVTLVPDRGGRITVAERRGAAAQVSS